MSRAVNGVRRDGRMGVRRPVGRSVGFAYGLRETKAGIVCTRYREGEAAARSNAGVANCDGRVLGQGACANATAKDSVREVR